MAIWFGLEGHQHFKVEPRSHSNLDSRQGLWSISALRLHFEVLVVLQTKPDGHL